MDQKSPPEVGSISFEDVSQRIEDVQFVLLSIMSEIDILMYKSNVYKDLASKTKQKRALLAERVETQVKGLQSFPEVIAKQSKADPTQMSDANAILTEESMYTILRKRISARYKSLVRDQAGLSELRKLADVTPASLKALAATLHPKVVRRRQEELLDAVEYIETVLRGDSRKHIREHLYATLVAMTNNPRSVLETLRFHYMILGPPGTGKSYLARTMAEYFKKIGLFVRGDMQNTKKPDLVASYVGQSAGKTRRAVYSALEGILFMDEAYALLSCEYVPGITPREVSKRDQYGLEAVDQLVDMMTELKGLLCIIVAGYQEEMDTCFLGTNPGLRRRFAHRWVLQRYTRADLLRILEDMLERRDSRADLVFVRARRIFGASTGVSVQEAALSFRPILYALDFMDALVNQAGDVEKLADGLYELYTIYGGVNMVRDDDMVALANSFLKDASNPARVHGFDRAHKTVDAIRADGVATRFQI